MVMTNRTIAPPMRVPMLFESPSIICWVNAGVPEISTFTPGGASELSIIDATVSSTDFWTSSDNFGASWIWMRVRIFEGTTWSRVSEGSESTIRSISSLDSGSVPPFALFRTSTTESVFMMFCCCRKSVSRVSTYSSTSELSGSLASTMRMIVSDWKFSS